MTHTKSDMELLARVANNVKRIRGDRHQASVATAAGISKSFMSEIENGHRGMSLPIAIRLSEALGVHLNDLIGQPDPLERDLRALEEHTGLSLDGLRARLCR